MAELTDEEVIDAMQGAGRRMTYVVANILRMTHKCYELRARAVRREKQNAAD